MPLNNYGVLIGTRTNYFRDLPDNFGRFYHGNIDVAANAISYRCAIDVDTQVTRVQWRIINFSPSDLGIVSALPDGWHHLASNEFSGAIDYIRSRFMWVTIRIPLLWYKEFRVRIPPWIVPFRVKPFVNLKVNMKALFRLLILDQSAFWRAGNNIDAIEQLESVINQGTKVFVFGQFFNTGNGVHDIHQNQGDPLTSTHSHDNGIWQDGATIVVKADGNLVGFFNKFETQSFKTDNLGHPI